MSENIAEGLRDIAKAIREYTEVDAKLRSEYIAVFKEKKAKAEASDKSNETVVEEEKAVPEEPKEEKVVPEEPKEGKSSKRTRTSKEEMHELRTKAKELGAVLKGTERADALRKIIEDLSASCPPDKEEEPVADEVIEPDVVEDIFEDEKEEEVTHDMLHDIMHKHMDKYGKSQTTALFHETGYKAISKVVNTDLPKIYNKFKEALDGCA